MVGILKTFFLVTGGIASLICGYFSANSVIRYFLISPSLKSISSNDVLHDPQKLTSEWRLSSTELLDKLIKGVDWGSFRPGYYFGMKSSSNSLASGIAWLDQRKERLRHEAQQDEIEQLDWIEHDGNYYGKQLLSDSRSNLKMTTSFVIPTNGQYSWIQKISVQPFKRSLPTEQIQGSMDLYLYLYLGFDCSQGCSEMGLSNIQILSAESSEKNVLFHMIGEHQNKKWISLQVISTRSDSLGGVSYQMSSEKNVHKGMGHLRSELLEGERSRIMKQDKWFDDFGDLRQTAPQSDVKFTLLQLRIKQPTDIYFVLSEDLSFSTIESLRQGDSVDSFKSSRIEETYSNLEKHYSQLFQAKFETFSTSMQEEFQDRLPQVQTALSSLLGGMGLFEGHSRIEWNIDENWDTIYPTEQQKNESTRPLHVPAADSSHFTKLFTATPSRTIFPRGFLWDEGFHQLVINRWDIRLTLRVLSSWLNAMYLTDYHGSSKGGKQKTTRIGWIPREMILGEDALQRVPDEFVTQRLNTANPPTFLLVLESMIDRYFFSASSSTESDEKHHLCDASSSPSTCSSHQDSDRAVILEFLRQAFPRLEAWVNWFQISQEASSDLNLPDGFRWRGRSLQDGKVVPNTLSSGLDDYPRGLYPIPQERHVDLLCWMMKSYQILDKISSLLSQQPNPHPFSSISSPSSSSDYQKKVTFYNHSLFHFHYSPDYRGFYDYGINNESAHFLQEVLFRCGNPETRTAIEGYIPLFYLQNQQKIQFCPEKYPQPLYPMSDGQGGYVTRERLIADNFTYGVIPRVGYVSLFPFLLKLLPITAEEALEDILQVMENPRLLYTDYGLRSMATTDKFYLKRNSPGDAPYWRGPIWININYLALAALHHYGSLPSKHQARIQTLYSKLRAGILSNVLKEQELTGYFWEQYDDKTGRGVRGHPFTGWTATIVNIFFEWY